MRRRNEAGRSSAGPYHSAPTLLGALVLLASAGLLAACGSSDPPRGATGHEHAEPPASVARAEIEDGPHPVAVVRMRDLGELRIELLPELAPKTVANFTKLANEGFYDGIRFHRVIPNFVIQGGCPLTKNKDPRDDGRGGTGYELPDEFTDYAHVRGTVAVANRGAPGTNSGSQFFIVHRDAPELNGLYSVFGRTVSGLETLDAIAALEIDKYGRYGPEDRPFPVEAVIESIRVQPAQPGPTTAAAAPLAPAPAEIAAAGTASGAPTDR